VLRDVIKVCDPVTKYLQTRLLDLTQAVALVEHEMTILTADRSQFEVHMQRAKEFQEQVQKLIDNHSNPEFDVLLETSLPPVPRRKRRMFDEQANDEVITDPAENYRVNAYLPVIDRLTQEISSRFNERNSELYQELHLLNPTNYRKVSQGRMSGLSLSVLAKLSDIEEVTLKEELVHFMDVHQHIMESPLPLAGEEHELEQDDEQLSNTNPPACSGNCMSCLGCIMKMLVDYRYHCRTYNSLYHCLKTALTLPCTVVSCERAFSKLKYVKSRLRSSLSQELTEALLVCSVKTDLLRSITDDEVYTKLSTKSSEMKKLLMF
jgi:hypothetical protein